MQHFVVTYEYSQDTEKRDALRAGHRAFLADQAQLLISGPTDDDGAVLVFRAQDAAEVGALLDQDPFTIEGVVASRSIRGWDPVLGSLLPAFRAADAG